MCVCVCVCMCVCTPVNERCRRKEERSKQGQKAKQHSICMSLQEARNIEVSVVFVRMEGSEGLRGGGV